VTWQQVYSYSRHTLSAVSIQLTESRRHAQMPFLFSFRLLKPVSCVSRIAPLGLVRPEKRLASVAVAVEEDPTMALRD
jgi:hypothetical protein